MARHEQTPAWRDASVLLSVVRAAGVGMGMGVGMGSFGSNGNMLSTLPAAHALNPAARARLPELGVCEQLWLAAFFAEALGGQPGDWQRLLSCGRCGQACGLLSLVGELYCHLSTCHRGRPLKPPPTATVTGQRVC